MNKRNSGIELVKVLAVIGIVISHAIPDGDTNMYSSAIDINQATADAQLFIVALLKNLGQLGNAVFIICSSWFLMESKKVNEVKIAGYIGDCFCISIISLVFFLALGYHFPAKYVIRMMFPVTFGNCWYLTCYLLLYAIHPLLNIVIDTINKRTFFVLVSGFITLYNLIGFLGGNGLFYWSELVGFVGVYFTVAYIKRYIPGLCNSIKENIILLCMGFFGWMSMMLLTNGLGLRFEIFSDQLQRGKTWMNPCFLLIAFSVFNLARIRKFYSKGINYVASMSLLIYMIHCNRIIRDYVRFDIFGIILSRYSYRYLIGWILLYAVITLVGSLVIAMLYKKTLQPIANKMSCFIYNQVKWMYSRLYSYMDTWGG